MTNRRIVRAVCLISAALTSISSGLSAQPDRIRLSSLTPRLANQGWGVLLFDRGATGNPLKIGDRQFAHGVRTHARSDLVYFAAGRYSHLGAWVGVDAETTKPDATAIFQVFADGRPLFDSGVMKAGTPARRVDVELGHANILRLIVSYTGTYADHVDWADAELTPGPPQEVGAETNDQNPVKRVPSGPIAFYSDGMSLSGLELANGQRIDLRGSMGVGPHARPEGSFSGRSSSSIRTASGDLSWDWQYISQSDTPWTAPIDTVLSWPNPHAKVWMAWGHTWQWQDPLEPRAFEDRSYEYGAFFNREHGLSLPMATIIDEDAAVGVTFIQSPDDVVLNMLISTTKGGELRFSRAFNRLGGPSSTLRFHMDVIVHEPDVRAALKAIVDRYPQYFDPPNTLVDNIGGGGTYSGYEGAVDARKLAAMGFTVNWKASLDFPYMGLFLPPVSDRERWNRFEGGGGGVYGPADEGKYGQTSIEQMNAYSEAMRNDGFYVLNYFNVTEFGGNIVYPAPVRKAGSDADLWRDPNDLLHARLEGAVLKTPTPIWTWGKAVIVDCGDPAYRAFLLEQARRHIDKLPASSGIAIDRMDWLTRYNPNADDGVTWIDGPQRHLRRSWMALMNDLGPLMHAAGKVIVVNDMDRRLELMREADGFYDEHGDYPFNLNTSAFLSLRKPLIVWTRDDDTLKPDPDAYFQRNLYLGAFPSVPFVENDHMISPSASNERFYLDYGALFNELRGRKWLLRPGVVRLADSTAKVNAYETPRGYVVFVGLGGATERARVTVQGLGTMAHVLYPGESDRPAIAGTGTLQSAVFDVPLKRGCAMLLFERAR